MMHKCITVKIGGKQEKRKLSKKRKFWANRGETHKLCGNRGINKFCENRGGNTLLANKVGRGWNFTPILG